MTKSKKVKEHVLGLDRREIERMRSASPVARCFMLEALLWMQDGSPKRGFFLAEDGSIPGLSSAAEITAMSDRDVSVAIAEIDRLALFRRSPDGALYSGRMLRDEQTRRRRGRSATGGNIESIDISHRPYGAHNMGPISEADQYGAHNMGPISEADQYGAHNMGPISEAHGRRDHFSVENSINNPVAHGSEDRVKSYSLSSGASASSSQIEEAEDFERSTELAKPARRPTRLELLHHPDLDPAYKPFSPSAPWRRHGAIPPLVEAEPDRESIDRLQRQAALLLLAEAGKISQELVQPPKRPDPEPPIAEPMPVTAAEVIDAIEVATDPEGLDALLVDPRDAEPLAHDPDHEDAEPPAPKTSAALVPIASDEPEPEPDRPRKPLRWRMADPFGMRADNQHVATYGPSALTVESSAAVRYAKTSEPLDAHARSFRERFGSWSPGTKVGPWAKLAIDSWNQGHDGLLRIEPPPSRRTQPRDEALYQALDELDVQPEELRMLAVGLCKSAFHRGENDSKWKADLLWVCLKHAEFSRFLESGRQYLAGEWVPEDEADQRELDEAREIYHRNIFGPE